jgi:acetyl-CoA carboxylase biotin carboxylase subunit
MEAGASVPPYYDSMIAKLIVHGDDRPGAVARLRDALDRFEISGVATNLSLLKTIVAHPDFREGRLDTRWLETVLLPSFIARKDS